MAPIFFCRIQMDTVLFGGAVNMVIMISSGCYTDTEQEMNCYTGLMDGYNSIINLVCRVPYLSLVKKAMLMSSSSCWKIKQTSTNRRKRLE
jgi:hypothetical protein